MPHGIKKPNLYFILKCLEAMKETNDKVNQNSTPEHESKAKAIKDFKSLTSSQQAEILKKHNPEAFAKISNEIANSSAKLRKVLHGITIVAIVYLFYYLLTS